jgi:predicted acyltransferase
MLWTPTFVMVTCGMGATLLAMLESWGRRVPFFEGFGANPLFIYVFAELLTVVTNRVRDVFSGGYGMSLAWSLIFVGVCWAVAWAMWRRRIFVKI